MSEQMVSAVTEMVAAVTEEELLSKQRHYKKCPFCGYEVVYDQMVIWGTGFDELLRHPLHPLDHRGLPCPLSGLLFRKVQWETRANLQEDK